MIKNANSFGKRDCARNGETPLSSCAYDSQSPPVTPNLVPSWPKRPSVVSLVIFFLVGILFYDDFTTTRRSVNTTTTIIMKETSDEVDDKYTSFSRRAMASLAFRNQQFKTSPQPQLHGQTFLATPVYQLGGAGPTNNQTYLEYLEQNGIGSNPDAWETWNMGVQYNNTENRAMINRPSETIVKLLLMTKDEGSLLKQWIVYHGELLGYENLYVLDGSIQPDSISFLSTIARDQWGVNVIFTPSNFDQLSNELAFVGRSVAKAADVIIKMDTDEFLALNTGDMSCDATVSISINNVNPYHNASSCQLSPYGLREYLQSSTDLQGHLTGRLMNVPQACLSIELDDAQCKEEGIADDLGQFAFNCIYGVNWNYKQVQDARIFSTTNLGGHLIESESVSPYVGFTVSPFGIFHYHYRCPHIRAENSRKAMVGHGYIAETDTPEMVREKYNNLIPPEVAKDVCGTLSAEHLSGHYSSVHKVIIYLKYIHGCPADATPPARGFTNPELAHFMEEFVVRYSKF